MLYQASRGFPSDRNRPPSITSVKYPFFILLVTHQKQVGRLGIKRLQQNRVFWRGIAKSLSVENYKKLVLQTIHELAK